VEMLALTGKAVEGDVLTAVEVIPKSETQQRVWSKYKKDVKYQWYGATFDYPAAYSNVFAFTKFFIQLHESFKNQSNIEGK
jgi:hypothetical protein